MLHMKRSLSSNEIYFCCQQFILGRNVDETTYLFNLYVNNTPYEPIALKAVHVMLALLIQKPRISKENLVAALTRRLLLWTVKRIGEVLYESQTMHDCLKAPDNAKRFVKISKNLKL